MGMCFLPASFLPAKAPSSGAPATKDRKERRETLSCFSITHSTLPQKSTCFSRRDLVGQSFGCLRSRLWTNQLAATRLLGGKQRQQKVLEPLALRNLQAPKLNADVVVPVQAHHGAGPENGTHGVIEMQTDVDRRANRDSLLRLDQQTFHADVQRFPFDFLPAITQQHLGMQQHPARAALRLLHGALRSAQQSHNTIFIQRLIEKKTGAGLETAVHGGWMLVIADQNDRCPAIERGITGLAR